MTTCVCHICGEPRNQPGKNTCSAAHGNATGSRVAGRCGNPDCPDGIYDSDIPCDVCGIGKPHATPDRAASADLVDRVGDSVIVALQEYSTDDLRAVAQARYEVNPGCWMVKLITEYIDVYR